MVGLVEASAGLGTTLGPVMGSTLYIITNYAWTFYAYGIINLVFALIVALFFPKNLKVVNDIEYDGVTKVTET
jgi:MFS family permease